MIITLIQPTSKDSAVVRRLAIIYVLKSNFYTYFLIQQKFLIFSKKADDVSRNQRMCHVISTFFETFLGQE